MAGVRNLEMVRGVDHDHARVVVEPRSRIVTVVVCDTSSVAAVALEPPRVRKLISILSEALRHLED